ncbi:MAG: 4'-phosphopantetheinyl transferase superfamily protein [Clostridiales bacterium]|nr:4'-phosphopantetheinyl transferase superfamily protein [Clostridiales bacterium]
MHPPIHLYLYPMGTKQENTERLLLHAKEYAALLGLKVPTPLVLHKTPEGKPCFPRLPQVHVSISHSGSYWLCAFAHEPIGADLQIHRPLSFRAIVKRMYHPLEQAYVQDDPRAFFDVWAAKESYVKFTGMGIRRSLFPSFCTVSGHTLAPQTEGARLIHLPPPTGYSLCLCTTAAGEVEVIPFVSLSES